MDFATKVLWGYVVLLLVGGLVGFLKAGSKPSLITSSIAAVLLILTMLPGVFQPNFARGMANVVLIVLLLAFTVRLSKTRKFMPAGMLLAVTILALTLYNVRF